MNIKTANLKSKKAFTLVELIVVIAIIAVLAAVLIPVIGSYVSDATDSAAKENMSTIESMINIEISEMGIMGAKILTEGQIIITFDSNNKAVVTLSDGLSFGKLRDGFQMTYASDESSIGAIFKSNLEKRYASLEKIGSATTYTVNVSSLNDQFVVARVTAS